MIKQVDVNEAKSALASLAEDLKKQAKVLCQSDPVTIADAAEELLKTATEELGKLLGYLNAIEHFGADHFSVRDMALCGDSMVVDFITPAGPGRMMLAATEATPVVLGFAPEDTKSRWQLLYS